MADERIEIVISADGSEVITVTEGVADQLGKMSASASAAGKEFIDAFNDLGKGSQAGTEAVKGSFDFMNSSIDAVLKGVITGTKSWQQEMDQILSQFAVSLAQNFANKIMSGLQTGVLGLLGLGGSGGAGGSGGGSGGLLSFLGPLLASLDTGAWSVPQDMLAVVHAGEMVLPANVAELARGSGVPGFPSGLAPSGGGAMTLNVSVSAIDAAGVASWANANAKTLATTIQRYMATNPSAAGA